MQPLDSSEIDKVANTGGTGSGLMQLCVGEKNNIDTCLHLDGG